jgi:uncharacterized protein YraI
MNKFITIAAGALAAAIFAPSIAAAAPGYVTTNLNVRAGPGTQYPAVAVFPTGARVDVIGCTSGFGWCDVQAQGVRGWVSGSYLDLAYQSRRVRAPSYAQRIGVPVISFSIGTYWDQNYRNRSWYSDRGRYGGPRAVAPRQEQRIERRIENRIENRIERQRDRIEDRRDVREDRREFRQDARQDARQERREERREFRQDRREDRSEFRRDRREERRN